MPDADGLAEALADHGIAAAVETHGRLAVLTLRAPSSMPEAAVRTVILAAARAAGFSSVAVDVTETNGPAA